MGHLWRSTGIRNGIYRSKHAFFPVLELELSLVISHFFPANMSTVSRRMQMVILSSPRVLETVRRVTIKAPINREKFSGLSRQFVPWLKYHNPQIEWKWEVEDSGDGGVEIGFSDKTVERLEEHKFESFHEICQAMIDADGRKLGER